MFKGFFNDICLEGIIVQSYFNTLYRKDMVIKLEDFLLECGEDILSNEKSSENGLSNLNKLRKHKNLDLYEIMKLLKDLMNNTNLSNKHFKSIDSLVNYTFSF